MYFFEALYFDGVSSSPRSCSLEVKPDSILVRETRPDGSEQRTLIEGQELKKSTLSSHGGESVFTLRIGTAGIQCFEVRNPEFKAALKTLTETARPRGVRESRPTGLLIGAIVAGMIGFVALSWFVLIPAVGDALGHAMPTELENTIASGLVDSLTKKYPVNKEKTALLYQYAAAINLPDVENLRFYVCESSQSNAFAVMGGTIFVFEPLLESLKSSDELAALLFHEYTHIEAKHTARATMRALAGYVFLSVIISDTSGVLFAILQNLETLQSLDYSRDFEREADAESVRMLAERSMDMDGFARLMENLRATHQDALPMIELLSTHPDEEERINTSRALATKYRISPPAQNVVVGDHGSLWEKLRE